MKAYWIENKNQKNYEICLTKRIGKATDATLHIIAKYTYNLFVNGQFVCYGPARAAGGYARVDYFDLSKLLTKEENIISIFCLSVETKTLCFSKGASYIGCELQMDGVTYDACDFQCFLMKDRVDKVERMSAQRGYVEVYRQSADRTAFCDCEPVCLVEREAPRLLERRVPFSQNERQEGSVCKQGGVTFDRKEEWTACLVNFLAECKDGDFYPLKDCETVLYRELCSMRFHEKPQAEGHYTIYDFGKTYSGKLQVKLEAKEDVNLWAIYDDLLIDGQVYFGREQIIHGLKWSLKKGSYMLTSAEVYTMRYLCLVSDMPISDVSVSLLRIENPVKKELHFGDEALQLIYDAAQNTFVQNAYDLYTDCPSRERAGWLCDSYFTARAEWFYTGDNVVEQNFLENYLLYEGTEFTHPGILPCCFPATPKSEDDFIPNWILWFLVELRDYVKRTGNTAYAKKFHGKIREILSYFQQFEDAHGFLENLRGWVFLEWSQANDFMRDVNFPSNMLYYGALRSAGELLDDSTLTDKAEELRENILQFSFDGEFFYDNAIWEDGVLVRTDNISETCQYFAAFFDIITEKEAFVDRLAHIFSPFVERPERFCAAPMFIGYVLRLFLLFDVGENERLLRECKEKFLPMAERTGTIWEFFDESASCNHGFGSIVGYFIAEAYRKMKQ